MVEQSPPPTPDTFHKSYCAHHCSTPPLTALFPLFAHSKMMNNKLLIINIAKSGEKTERKEKWLARESAEPLHFLHAKKQNNTKSTHC